MVRLINGKNIEFICNMAYAFMHIQEYFTHIRNWNYPKTSPCIFAMWHANQFAVHGLENKGNINILISNSIDGEIVSRACSKFGFKIVRGSSGKKGAVESTMQMISRLKAGENVAIMIDGPSGPLHKVKNGVIKLAQKTGVPIIPVHWYSPQKTFVTLPSWDKMTTPLFDCNILNAYGTPIYIKEDATEEEITAAKEEIKKQLFELEENIPQYYEEAKKNNLWKK